MGNVPVPVWGVFGYLFFLSLLALSRIPKSEKQGGWAVLFLLAAIFSLYSVALALISTFLIHSYCIMCILSYGVNFSLLYMIWLVRRRFDPQTNFYHAFKRDVQFFKVYKAKTLPVITIFSVAAMLMILLYPTYWQFAEPSLSTDITTGITEEGYPWIGAEKPELEITEFADYQCFQCQKMHFYLRELVDRYPDKIRLIHRQFPLDSKFNPLIKDSIHVGSGKMALLAEYAKTQGKFWQMNDVLFEMAGKGKFINTRAIGEKTGLDYRALALSSKIPSLRYALKHDIAIGIERGITGTPGYVIKGKIYQGQIPPEILREVTG